MNSITFRGTVSCKSPPYNLLVLLQVEHIKSLEMSEIHGKDTTAPDKFCDTNRCDLEFPSGVSVAANQQPELTGSGSDVSRKNLPSDATS